MAEVKVIVTTVDKGSKNVKSVDDKLKSMLGTVGKLSAGVVAAGAVFKQAFDLSQEGANLNQLEDSFNHLNASILHTPGLLEEMRKAARGTITDAQLMEGVLKLTAGTSDELGQAFANAAPRLLEIAKASNKLNPALGDTAFLYESISTGIKRQSPLILDNLGIVVKVGEANEKYAAQLGKTVTQLTAEEKQMALLNAVMDSGGRLIEQVGGNVDSQADAWARLSVRTQEATNDFKQFLAEGLLPTIEGLANTGDALEESSEKGRSGWLNALTVLTEFTNANSIGGRALRKYTQDQQDQVDAVNEATKAISQYNPTSIEQEAAIKAASIAVDEQSDFVRGLTRENAELDDKLQQTGNQMTEYEASVAAAARASEDATAANEAHALSLEEIAGNQAALADSFNSIINEGENYESMLGGAEGATDSLNASLFEQIQAHSDNATEIALAGIALGQFTEAEAQAMLKSALLEEKIKKLAEGWDGTEQGLRDLNVELAVYIAELNNIPDVITTEVVTNYSETGRPPTYSETGEEQGNAQGGIPEFASGGWTGAAGGIVHPNELVIPSHVLMAGAGAMMDFASRNVPGGVGSGSGMTIGAVNIYQQPGEDGQALWNKIKHAAGREMRINMRGR